MISFRDVLKLPKVYKTFVIAQTREKHRPDHWSVVRKKVHPIHKALDHFDDFYNQVFGKKWKEIRTGLLGKQKYVAVVNNYSDSSSICKKLEYGGALNIRKLFNLEKDYIEERYTESKRLRNLLKIWEKEKKLGNNANEAPNEEVENTNFENLSLENSLKGAEIDSDRIIDVRYASTSEVLQEFVPATELKGKEDFIPESSHYEYYDANTNITVKIEREFDIHFPENLNVYSYEIENDSSFKSPQVGSTEVFDYYLMDGGSILPVLALDLRPNDTFLDMCAAPGGKSLLALQTLYPSLVTSNDCSKSRVDRIYNVFNQFLFDFDKNFLKTNKVMLSQNDGRFIKCDPYDKILVDVPCTTDRHSLKENDNNIFKPSRIKERLKLPEFQSELLFNALCLVKKGGIVVYSTCSLSPIQNDGVIHMTLKKIWEETKMEIIVKDLTPALLQARCLYQLASPKLMKYGHLVLPCNAQNFGPTYFCKLQRIN
ncbi:hypothetical protein WA026_000443 [Henosepilachna vigintioctopunctata]|uniref:NOL1/NOP2/Sun domain family member 4 n=1 Tax=Henosepilachna vigintioctopunctata TaxID=420089 RepID=A0AAW1V4Z3_9CUCU